MYMSQETAMAFVAGVQINDFAGPEMRDWQCKRKADNLVEVDTGATVYVVIMEKSWIEYLIKE